MAYIYKITNSINGKIYIGKTSRTIEERFREHCQDSKNCRREHLPLYSAMRKYGVQNFSVEEVEQCEDSAADEREIYWISRYGSFGNGYNATLGGDGSPCIDRDLVIKTYKEEHNQTKTAAKLGISTRSVHNILIQNNIPIESNEDLRSKAVAMLDKETLKVIQIFPSASAANRFLGIPELNNSIREVCHGRSKTSRGYVWKFVDDLDSSASN